MQATETQVLDSELAGLDRLETIAATQRPWYVRAWSATWPMATAVAIAITCWQLVAWLVVETGWQKPGRLPFPRPVFEELWTAMQTSEFWQAVGNTMQRAVIGYFFALVIGATVGCAVAAFRPLRSAVGSLITGLQTMPSIAWFPAAIVLFGLEESAIMFVVVLGAAPSVANGILSGIDTVPPTLIRAGRVLGAKGPQLYRKVIIPAALPTTISGLKQGWAFAWRSLMAGELLVIIAAKPSIGSRMQFAREFLDVNGLYALMVVILVIGIVVDLAFFGRIEQSVLRRRGLGKD